MFIIGLGTAAPPNCFSKLECWETLIASQEYYQLQPRSRAILKKVLNGENGIQTRRLALTGLNEAFALTPDALHARFRKAAPEIATQAARGALHDAGRDPTDIDAILISTCTGYLCPGLTSYVSESLGLRSDVLALDLVGQGCGAALPNLRTAEALLTSRRAANVLSICVEICSAAFYLDDDPGVLISACLFGDGAGAAVLSEVPAPGKRTIRWRSALSSLSAPERDYLRLEQKNGMLRNILAPQVPALAARHVETVLTQSLAQAGLAKDKIKAWIMHAGGQEVLAALRERLQLSETDLRWSARILREYGNVSSPCVLFVLQAALAEPAPGGFWWMSSFGAGFSCHGALLEVE